MISNRFFVTALDDGTTLHGNLSVDGSLSQAWTGSAAVPDWSTVGTEGKEAQPTIRVTLISGNTYIGTSSSSPNGYISESKWFYNDNGSDSEIIFSNTPTDITIGESTVRGFLDTNMGQKFLKTEVTFTYGTGTGEAVNVPALRIIQNLASSSNVDLDTITFKGKYNSGSGVLDFAATAQIRVSLMSSGGFLGVISFAGGISDITQKNQVLTLIGQLYDATGNVVPSQCEWKLNGDVVQEKPSTATQSSTLEVGESYDAQHPTRPFIVDNAVVQCDFYKGTELAASAYASIDDMQDSEYMYIQYAGANGNAASLRKGQTATFDIWIGTNDNPTVDTTYAYFQVKLIDGSGNVITGSLTGINPVVSDGWRNLDVDNTTKKAAIAIAYDVADTNGKNITGLIRASTSPFTV